MSELTSAAILDALRNIRHPKRDSDVVSLNLISGIAIKDGNVGFALEIESNEAEQMEPVRRACENAVKTLPGVRSCAVAMTAERSPGGRSGNQPPPQLGQKAQAGASKPLVPGVKSIIAVASGKGGVGKSTTSINLALALSRLGKRIGLLDADIYGPSVPRMAGVSGRPSSPDGHKLNPMDAYGIKLMSMGFLVDEDAPMIWRGPMVQSALQQMLGDVAWGELDILVVDMPPGTGDAQLTMAQRVPLAGAVIVSTPQDIALLDAKKAVNMFRRVDVPILGVVENMSYFLCPKCGERSDIFAHGGARQCSDQFGVSFLAEVPLDIAIRETSDDGKPIVVSSPQSPQAEAYMAMGTAVLRELSGRQVQSGPAIVMN